MKPAQTHKAPTVSAAVRNAESAARRAAQYSDNASAASTAAQHHASLAANHAAEANSCIRIIQHQAQLATEQAEEARLYANTAKTCLLIGMLVLSILLILTITIN